MIFCQTMNRIYMSSHIRQYNYHFITVHNKYTEIFTSRKKLNINNFPNLLNHRHNACDDNDSISFISIFFLMNKQL